MNFQELVAEVVRNTNRPDLGFAGSGGDEQIPKAVLSATLSLHTCDFFWRDIISADVIFDTSAYIQTLDTQAIPRFRSIAFFRKWDPSFNAVQQNPTTLPPLFNGLSTINIDLSLRQLETIDLGGVFDSYGTEKQDVCYAAGTTLYIKSSTPVPMGKLSYYAYPDLDISGNGARFTSWIADNHPWAIIYTAEAFISQQTGDLETAREYNRPAQPRDGNPGGLVTQQVATLRMSNIEAGGR